MCTRHFLNVYCLSESKESGTELTEATLKGLSVLCGIDNVTKYADVIPVERFPKLVQMASNADSRQICDLLRLTSDWLGDDRFALSLSLVMPAV